MRPEINVPKTVELDGIAAEPKIFWTLGKLLEVAGAVEKLKLEPVLAPAHRVPNHTFSNDAQIP